MRFILVVLALLATVTAAGAAPKVIWKWSLPGMEIYGADFSADSRDLAFVRQRHWPTNRERMADPAAADRLKAQVEANPRYVDPQVVVARVGQKAVKAVGWGWEPKLSPKGPLLVYVQQRKPLKGRPVDASVLQGNPIFSFDRKSGKAVAVVKPADGYVSAPSFSGDGKRLAYLIGRLVTPTVGLPVGVGMVTVTGKRKNVTMLSPVKQEGLFRLIGPPVWSAGRILALRVSPLDVKQGKPTKSVFELMSLGAKPKVVFSWGQQDPAFQPIFGVTTKGRAVVFDTQWRIVDVKTGKAKPMPGAGTSSTGVLSPDGKRVAELEGQSVYVGAVGLPRNLLPVKLPAAARGLLWSPDGRYLAVVVRHFKKAARNVFDRDELIVIRLR